MARVDPSDSRYTDVLLALTQARILRNAPVSLLASVLDEASLVQAPAGEALMREGDTDTDAIYLLVSGALDVVAGGKHIVTLTEPGEVIGEIGPFSGRPRMADVRARTECLLIRLSHRRFAEIRGTNPERYAQFVGLILFSLTEKIRALTERVKTYEFAVTGGTEAGHSHPLPDPDVAQRLREIVLYSHVVQNSPNPVLIAGPDGRLAMLNPAAQEWFGVEAPGNDPPDLAALLPFMAGDFSRLFNREVAALKAEGTVRTRHAGERMVEVAASTVMLRDELIAHTVMLRDVSADRALTQSLRESKEALAAYSRRLEAAVSERTAALRETNASLREANEQLAAETREKDRALRQLREAQGVLLQSEKMAALGQLATGVAHEINNPMGFVYSNLNSVREYFTAMGQVLDLYAELDDLPFPPDSPAARVIAEVKAHKRKMDFGYVMRDGPDLIADSLDGAARVVAIVKNLKDFSRVDSREKEWANLNAGLESTLKIIWNELKYKAEIEKDYGDIGEVECYPQQLNQVFLNLLVNAAQAIEKFGKISIRTWKEEGGVAVEIQDTGCGIPPQNLGRIFDPFFTTKPAGKGTGLGLSVVYNIVRQHHGRIDVESEPGKGTRFVVHIPTRAPAPEAPL